MKPWGSGGRKKDDELDEELEAHLAMAVRDRVERGQSPAEAEMAARRELGNVATIREVTREMWGWTWIEQMMQDLRYAARLLRRNPGFTTIAVLSLALGVGANTALFQVINAVRLRSLPVASPATLAEIRLVDPDGARGNFNSWHPSLTNPIWEQIRERQQAFGDLFAWGANQFNLAQSGETKPAPGLWVSGGFFDALGVRPVVGRLLTDADDQRGCPARAVLSYRFWQREYGGERSVVGRTVTIDSKPAEIIGVTQAGFFGLEVGRTFDVALPICAEPIVSGGGGRLESGTTWWLSIMGHVRAGSSLPHATAQLGAISPALFQSTLPAKYPAVSVPKYLNFKLAAFPAGSGISWVREEYEPSLWLLQGTAVVVLLIACANLANLLLARASARQREIAVRLGLGASRRRVIRQLLTESLLLAGVGAALGALLAGRLSTALVGFLKAADQSVILDLGTDWRVLGFTIGLAVLTCVLFGLAPAIKATGIGTNAVLKAAGRGMTADRDRAGLRRALVAAQVALSLVLLFGALLFARSLYNLLTVDPGFRDQGVVVASIDMRQLDLPVERRHGAIQDVLDRLRALPGVQAAATVGNVPISGNASGNEVWIDSAGSRRQTNSLTNRVSSGYFETLDIPILAGRDFDAALDNPSSIRVAMVNEAFARELMGGSSPIGARFTREATPSEPETVFRIVGLVKDAKYLSLRETIGPTTFFPKTQDPRPGNFARVVLRSSLPAEAATAAISRSLADLSPRIGVSYGVLTTQIGVTVVRERLMATLSGFFGGLAAILTLVGLYGVIAYTVARRTSEIGVRIALGASRANVLSLILREAGLLVSTGIAMGVVLAILAARQAASLLFGLEPADPLTLSVTVLALVAVALVASYIPARAATRIDPVVALRVE